MNVGGGVVGGALGGLVGAAIWGGISYFTGYEIGWIAWGVGGLVGLGCSLGSGGKSTVVGCIAVVITLLSIAAGKYTAVQFAIRNEIGSEEQIVQQALANLQEDETIISYMADSIIGQLEAQGQTIEWPQGVDPNEAVGESAYPPAIWSEAKSMWGTMLPQEREKYREQLAEDIRVNVHAFFSDISSHGFLGSFGAMDLLFFGLAVVTAFKIGAKDSKNATESDTNLIEVKEEEPQAG